MLSKFHHRNTGKKLAFKGQNEAKTRSIDVIGHSKSLGKKLTRRRTFKSEFFFFGLRFIQSDKLCYQQ